MPGWLQADFRRKISSFSLQPQSEQLRQQKIKTPTPTVMSTASPVPNESKVCGEKCMGQYLIEGNAVENAGIPSRVWKTFDSKAYGHGTLVSSSVALDSLCWIYRRCN